MKSFGNMVNILQGSKTNQLKFCTYFNIQTSIWLLKIKSSHVHIYSLNSL